MRILLACPITIARHRVLFPWLKHIRALQVPAGDTLDFYFVDNSEDRSGRQRVNLRALGFAGEHLSERVKTPITTGDMLARCWNIIRDKVLHEGYDYHFSLELDVFPPPAALVILMAHARIRGCRVCGFTYPLRGRLAGQLCLFFPWRSSASLTVVGTPLRTLRFADGSLRQAAGIGQGCLLVHRSVYERITFRAGDSRGWPDAHFATDCIRENITQWCDTAVIAEHRD